MNTRLRFGIAESSPSGHRPLRARGGVHGPELVASCNGRLHVSRLNTYPRARSTSVLWNHPASTPPDDDPDPSPRAAPLSRPTTDQEPPPPASDQTKPDPAPQKQIRKVRRGPHPHLAAVWDVFDHGVFVRKKGSPAQDGGTVL
ncbi:hypothetical protein B2J93_3297 [Marssonina coronariae]|uniref:Uncharacterized protein n=1 Tax=Diplocarpon coronariae TaxID=2795749 RepID=A0A218ZDD4_9HELO|nr:hypothetical protein B2J93_3297 [Marssonina coronariae]